ncbi:MAG: hypothetical protein HYS32_02520 [Candidatus Woesearchaeota archaeon]|nr:MAG: hypothetical protein HYS32_02520 [Candidatus Woesearchaeota archaeon]
MSQLIKNKRGVAATFLWIFVAIAGAIILIFFISFAAKHGESSSTVTNIVYLDTVSNIITNFAVSLEADKSVQLPTKIEVYFDCEGLLMVAKERDFTKKIPNNIVFGTERFLDNEILLWTVPWKLPYTITNLIYVTSPHVKYFLIYDSSSQQLVNDIKSQIPARFKVEVVDVNNLRSLEPIDKDAQLRSYYKNKFVFFTEPKLIQEISEMKTPATIVEIKPGDYGQIIYHLNNSEKSINYISKELIYGAIFVDDPETYQCLVQKSLDKVGQIASLYAEKARLLQIKSTQQNCLYTETKNTLEKQQQSAKSLNTEEVFLTSSQLVEQNRHLDNQGCSLIF